MILSSLAGIQTFSLAGPKARQSAGRERPPRAALAQGPCRSFPRIVGRLVVSLLFGPLMPALGQNGDFLEPDEGRPVLSWEDAGLAVGRPAFVFGKVVAVGRSGSITFLNFSKERGKFTGIIRSQNYSRFEGDIEKRYLDQAVVVQGIVDTYRGQPQIEITRPEHIRVVEAFPKEHKPARTAERPRESVTVASYNVLNLFDDFDDPAHSDEGTPPKPRAEMARLAARFRELDADVVALEEVENREVLTRFLETYLIDMGYEVVQLEGNDIRGIDVCLVSRIPVGRVTSHAHLTFPGPEGSSHRFKRDVLAVEILPRGEKPFEVWIVHLQSNFEGKEFAEPVRLSEATALRGLLDQRLAADRNARILVAGDFNDTWESDALKKIVGAGPSAFTCFMTELSEGERITYNKAPYRSMIDFILCSPAMAAAYQPGSYRVIPGSVENSGSDHNPISAAFRLKESKGTEIKKPADNPAQPAEGSTPGG